jgi:hypothetical protein
LLETREDTAPREHEAFLVIDTGLLVQAVSRNAQALLGLSEEQAVNRPVIELLTPADAEGQAPSRFAGALAAAAASDELGIAFVRPWNTFGVRLRARVAPCGPPRAALVVLEDLAARPLRAVP